MKRANFALLDQCFHFINFELTPSQNFPDGKIALFAAEFFIRFTHYPATLGTRRFECSKITLNCFTLMTFCLLNDIAIAANYLLHHKIAEKILIIDLDVHQGNGTAQIFSQEPRVFTFSMHGAKNYPVRKVPSDLDIGLPDKTEDEAYLKTLREALPRLIDRVQPQQVFYLSGVDVIHSDKLGRLSLSIQGCRERDRFVLETCKKNGLPVAISMGGGYSERLAHIIEAHANTYRLAQEIYF